MRVEIKTGTPVKDPDIKAIYLLKEAMKISTPEMLKANLEFCGLKKMELSDYQNIKLKV